VNFSGLRPPNRWTSTTDSVDFYYTTDSVVLYHQFGGLRPLICEVRWFCATFQWTSATDSVDFYHRSGSSLVDFYHFTSGLPPPAYTLQGGQKSLRYSVVTSLFTRARRFCRSQRAYPFWRQPGFRPGQPSKDIFGVCLACTNRVSDFQCQSGKKVAKYSFTFPPMNRVLDPGSTG
jgi:hypothetical protein